jgi:hypothetical protein
MRWMMIALLVSLGALLLAAGGVARHIWLRRSHLNSHPDAGAPGSKSKTTLDSIDPIDEIDH